MTSHIKQSRTEAMSASRETLALQSICTYRLCPDSERHDDCDRLRRETMSLCLVRRSWATKATADWGHNQSIEALHALQSLKMKLRCEKKPKEHEQRALSLHEAMWSTSLHARHYPAVTSGSESMTHQGRHRTFLEVRVGGQFRNSSHHLARLRHVSVFSWSCTVHRCTRRTALCQKHPKTHTKAALL